MMESLNRQMRGWGKIAMIESESFPPLRKSPLYDPLRYIMKHFAAFLSASKYDINMLGPVLRSRIIVTCHSN